MVTKASISLDLNNHIDVVENISREDFQNYYMIPQRPVIIKHLYGKNAKVYDWTFDYFSKELGHIDVGVFDDESEKRQDDRSYKKLEDHEVWRLFVSHSRETNHQTSISVQCF